MRMTDEQFKQELFLRCQRAQTKKKRRRKIILTVCIPLCCAGVITALALHNVNTEQMYSGVNQYVLEVNGDYDIEGDSDNSFVQEPESAEYAAASSVFYSELDLPRGVLNEEALELTDEPAEDISEFDEATLSRENLRMIIEGTVTKLSVKSYEYDVYSDKFERGGVLHNTENTVVYEVEVEKTWYGEDITGEKILIEDMNYFTEADLSAAEEPVLSLKEGKRYVLPLYEYGDSIYSGEDYAGGNIARESSLSIVYPYHPQIEATKDGSYLISDDWKTLTAKNATEVIMDTMDGESIYRDKMRLVDGDTFWEQMDILISKIKETEAS